MKKIIITDAKEVKESNTMVNSFELLGDEDMEASDGYHTFGELYEHRITLFITLCKKMLEVAELKAAVAIARTIEGKIESGIEDINPVWRAKLHADGTMFEGWFILGLWDEDAKQITYHLPLKKWDETSFAETFDTAPGFDGHTSSDVLERLKSL